MGFRTIVINKHSKLESKLGYLVIRTDKEERVHLSEIDTLIIESTAVAITAMLLSELIKNNVNIIFCDEKHLPHSQLTPFYANYNISKNIKIQQAWLKEKKDIIWAEIIKHKIEMQANNLFNQNLTTEFAMLTDYAQNVKCGDLTNREGHAAKVYFNSVFHKKFVRGGNDVINTALDYGYSMMLSIFSREIVAAGYLTQLGIWHDNEFNFFNLSCDLMEPFRPIVDWLIIKGIKNVEIDFKKYMKKIFLTKIKINKEEHYLSSAIRVYIRRIFKFLNNEVGSIYKIERFQFEEI